MLVAPDSYKGTLTAEEAAQAIARGLMAELRGSSIDLLPLGDGGDGTVDALGTALDGEFREVTVTDPLGKPVCARFAVLPSGTALLEMATASGLTLVPPSQLDPFEATTFGTGEMLLEAGRSSGDIVMGIGGSATVDGGVGMARAMGARFLAADGREITGGPRDYPGISLVDFGEVTRWKRGKRLRVMSDVDNPLCGPRGAARVFGPQKGAREEDIPLLDSSLRHLGRVLSTASGRRVQDIPGAGAAGGMGAMLVGMLDAELLPGSSLALDLVDFRGRLDEVDLVVTGEGRLDSQTSGGKLPLEVARRSRAAGVLVAVLPGYLDFRSGEAMPREFDYVLPCFGGPAPGGAPPVEEAREALIFAARELARTVLCDERRFDGGNKP